MVSLASYSTCPQVSQAPVVWFTVGWVQRVLQ